MKRRTIPFLFGLTGLLFSHTTLAASPRAVQMGPAIELRGFETPRELVPRGQLGSFRTFDDQWLLSAVVPGEAGEGILILSGNRSTEPRPLATPTWQGSLLASPTLLLSPAGELEWILWFEGTTATNHALKGARWNDDRWDSPTTISPTGAGSQIALTSARLATGDWLIAWAAFDGSDDEILWSRSRKEGWAAPSTLEDDDAAPDVLPSLMATEAGVLATWSEYDGSAYRTRLARFMNGGWTTPETVGANRATLPRLVRAEGRILLVEASPSTSRGWVATELDGEGHTLGQVLIETGIATAPHQWSFDADGLEASWDLPASRASVPGEVHSLHGEWQQTETASSSARQDP